MANTTRDLRELLRQGIALAKAGHKEQARQTLMQVVEMDEQCEQAWLWLSGVVDSVEDRRICLENILTINPDNSAAQAGLRWLDTQTPAPLPSMPGKATGEAIRAPPEDLTTKDTENTKWVTRGGTFEAPPEANDTCPGCGARLPSHGKTCPACGLPLIIACPGCGEYADIAQTACPACSHALGDFRQGARYYLQLAQAHLKQAHFPLAKEMLALAQANAPQEVQWFMDTAELHQALEQIDQAMAAYRQAIALDPTQGAAYVYLGDLYEQCGQANQAQAMVEQALQKDSRSVEHLFTLARRHLGKDPTAQRAVGLLEQVIRLSPKHAPAHLLMGRAYRIQHKKDLALAYYQSALQLAGADSKLGRQAQREIEEVEPAPIYQPSTGWGETLRRMSGLVLLPMMAAWINARLTLLEVSPLAWLAVLAAMAGAYLWVSGTDVPQNPGMRQVFGQAGVKGSAQQSLEIAGYMLWMLAFGLILIKI